MKLRSRPFPRFWVSRTARIFRWNPRHSSPPPAPDPTPLIQQAFNSARKCGLSRRSHRRGKISGNAEHDLWWPTVNAWAAVGLAPVRDDHISSWYGGVGVNINIPVFNGFLFNARAKSADLETELKRKKLQDCRTMWRVTFATAGSTPAKRMSASVTKQLERTSRPGASTRRGALQTQAWHHRGIQPGGIAKDGCGLAGYRCALSVPRFANRIGLRNGNYALTSANRFFHLPPVS